MMGDERLADDEGGVEEAILTEGGGMRMTSSFSAFTVEGGEVRFRIAGPMIDFIELEKD